MSWGEVLGTLGGAYLGSKAAKDATGAQVDAARAGMDVYRQAIADASGQVKAALPFAERNILAGAGGALDVLKGSYQPQSQLLTGGYQAAQRNLLAGMPQASAAILGRQPDMSALQAYTPQAPALPNVATPEFQSFSSTFDQPVNGLSGTPAQQTGDPIADQLAAQGWKFSESKYKPGTYGAEMLGHEEEGFGVGGMRAVDTTGQNRGISDLMDSVKAAAAGMPESQRAMDMATAGGYLGGIPGMGIGALLSMAYDVYDNYTDKQAAQRALERSFNYGGAGPGGHSMGGGFGGSGQATGTESPGSAGSVGHGGGMGL